MSRLTSIFLRKSREGYQKKDEKDAAHRRRYKSPLLISLDAWIDNGLYQTVANFASRWEAITIFSRRFRVRGLKRLMVEILDEGLTLGLIGFSLFTMVGLAVFEVTKGNWQEREEFAITILDRYNTPVGQRGSLHDETVPVEEMPDHVIKAVLATEDRRFFDHFGIDFQGLFRALSQNAKAGGVVQGGSTLTQQLAKNLFLSNERTIKRKIREAYLALWLEANLSKKEILQLYLERAYMGGGNFGIASASQFYFGKNIRDVSLSEAAMLAGLFKAPGKYAPHINLPAARARANVVLSNLVESAMMSEGEIAGARRQPASVLQRSNDGQPDYFLDWIFDEIQKMGNDLPEHTLTVRSTLDPRLQKAAEESIEFYLRQYGHTYRASQAASVVLANDGAVRAIVGGRDYGTSQFNRATRALRQTGSSFKPYVYAVAMENGLTPQTIVSDAPINWAGWQPRNYGRGYAGRVDLATALAKSLNTVPVRLAYQYLGRSTQQIVDLTKKMGIESEIQSHRTMVLGTSGMTVMDQATGFSVFANGGIAGNRHGFTQIYGSSGQLLWDWSHNNTKTQRVLSQTAATYMNEMLVGVSERGTARRAQLPMTRVAGKTGTTQSYRDAWFVGFTGNYTAAVWVGNDDFSPMNRLTGGVMPAQIWQRMMLYAHQNITIKPIYGLENTPPPSQVQPSNQTQDLLASGELPQILSPAVRQVLHELAQTLDTTPPIKPPSGDEFLASDLRQGR